MKAFKTTMFAAAAAVLVAGTASAEKWDMPMAYAASNFHSEMGVVFAEKVKSYTNGDIEITVHPGGSLFKGGEIKRAVQTGQAPIGERLLSSHANELPILGWDNLPFLASTYDANEKLWQAAKDTVNAQLADQNLVVLYTCPWPGQGFYFKKAVTSSADTQGIKFRSYNTATAQIAKELGMLPVQVEAAELSQALATGVAEAFISSGATGYDRKVWEHLSHYYKVNAWLPRNFVIINKGVWDGLSSGTQADIQRAADETGAACLAKSEGLANWYFEQLEANGMQVIDAGPEFLKELKAIGAKMQGDWVAASGSDGKAVINAYKKM